MFGYEPDGMWQKLPQLPRSARLIRALRAVTELLLGASLVFIGAVLVDSVYFRSLSISINGRSAAVAQILSPAH